MRGRDSVGKRRKSGIEDMKKREEMRDLAWIEGVLVYP
jgi:hypothetical protein